MARYQYETSPRKIEKEYNKKSKRLEIKEVKIKAKSKSKKSKAMSILKVLAVFAILLTISYRNSLMNEKFTEIKNKKNELATIEKENEQLKVNIESKTNLMAIEEKAQNELGMEKQNKNQTRYINIEKQDFIEIGSDNKIKKENKSLLKKIIEIVTNI